MRIVYHNILRCVYRLKSNIVTVKYLFLTKNVLLHLWSVTQRQETKCCHLSLMAIEKCWGFCNLIESHTLYFFYEPDRNSPNSNLFLIPYFCFIPSVLTWYKTTTLAVNPRDIKKPSTLYQTFYELSLLDFGCCWIFIEPKYVIFIFSI